MIRRLVVVVMLTVLAGCAARPAGNFTLPAPSASTEPPPGQCRIGGEDGIPVSDRGIGGTGAPATMVTDRGIGGTGQRTGIVGVITGFASVCLAGQEVHYAPGLPVLVDDRPGQLADLRAGQVVAIEAAGVQPTASRIVVRHEVFGPLERIEPDGALRIAGQRVLPPPDIPASTPGGWFFVSGFRREDGAIVATRLDPRGPGEVMVRGIMRNDRGHLYIGLLEIHPGRDQFREPGVPVIAIGRWNDGVLEADTVEPDALLLDPGAFFGPQVRVLVIEGYAEGGFFHFGRSRYGAPFAPGRALLRLERDRGGAFAPAFVRPFGPGRSGLFGARTAFEPAPTPNRRLFGGGPFGRSEQFGSQRPAQQRGFRRQRGEGDPPGGGDGFRFRPGR